MDDLKYKDITFKSKVEVEMAKHLDKIGVEWDYEEHELHYIIEYKYTPDFYLPEYNGFIEVKGKLDVDTRRKHKALQQQFPDEKIIFAFMRGQNKIRKGSKTTYMDWAIKMGFKAWNMFSGLFSKKELTDLMK